MIVLGLDGGDLDILEHLIRKYNIMPNLQYLMKNGYVSYLHSTIPPITAPAWASMATGLNPGKTGIYHFFKRKNNRNTIVSISMLRGKTYWDILSTLGYKVGVFNYPFLYPPYPVNGFITGGFGTPPKGRTFPKDLENELKIAVGPLKLEHSFSAYDKYISFNDFYMEMKELIENKRKIIQYLLNNYNLHLYVFVISELDFIQHRYYSHLLYGKEKHLSKVLSLYNSLDDIIGDIILWCRQNDATLFVVSDHGFTQLRGYVNLVKILAKYNYPIYREKKLEILIDKLTNLYPKIKHLIPYIIKMRGRELIATIKGGTKGTETIWIDTNLNDAAMIYVNDEQHELSTDKLPRIIERAIKDSLGLRDVRIYTKPEIYWGPYSDEAPDIVVILQGYKFIFSTNTPEYTDFSQNTLDNVAIISGVHRTLGIFIAWGSEIASNSILQSTINNISSDTKRYPTHMIYDVLPTILYYFGVSPPSEVDGRVIHHIFISKEKALLPVNKYMKKTLLLNKINKLKEQLKNKRGNVKKRTQDIEL